MAMIDNETHIRLATCPTHGKVTAEKPVPKLKFPFIITGIARGLAAARPYAARRAVRKRPGPAKVARCSISASVRSAPCARSCANHATGRSSASSPDRP